LHPAWSNPYILPPEYAVYIDESIAILEEESKIINDHYRYSLFGRWDAYISFLKTIKAGIENPIKDIQARKEFVENIDKLSARRNLDFPGTFPEMVKFYEDCKLLTITE
jgi:hypothetical protein